MCLTCSNVENEEECILNGQLQTCTKQNQICMTTVRLTPGKMYFTKGCVNSDQCMADLMTTKSLCHSGDVVFQNGFAELLCYDCCNSTACNSHILNGTDPLATTLNNFNRTMQPSRLPGFSQQVSHFKGQTLALNFWIGLRKQGDSYLWESGEMYDDQFHRFLPMFEGPPDHGCVRELGEGWHVINCSQLLPFVCQRDTMYSEARVTKQPSDQALLSHGIEWIQNKDRHDSFMCEVKGYHPLYSVVWVKDGIYHSSGLPPYGFRLNITKDLMYQLNAQQQDMVSSLQGYYHCEVWSINGTAIIASKPALLTFKDVLTYQGSIHLQGFPLTNSLEESLLQWRALNTVQEAIGLVEHLATVTMTNIVFTPQVKINGHSNRSRGYFAWRFSLFYVLSDLGPSQWPAVIEYLNVTIPWDYRHRYKKFMIEFDQQFLKSLRQKVSSELPVNYTSWNDMYSNTTYTLLNVDFRSTVACEEVYITKGDDIHLRFMTSMDQTSASSDEICFSDGEALATRPCIGNFEKGVSWGRIEYRDNCVQPDPSPVTRQLRELYHTRINIHTVDRVALGVMSLTQNGTLLNFVDVVYTSKILRNLACSHNPGLKVGHSIVKSMDNLYNVSRNVIAAAQLIDKASTRMLNSLDTFSRRLKMNESSLHSNVKASRLSLDVWESYNISQIAIGIGLTNDPTDDVVNFFTKDWAIKTLLNSSDFKTAILFSQDVFLMARDFIMIKDEMLDIFGMSLSPTVLRTSYTIHRSSSFFMAPSYLHNSSLQYVANSDVISGEISGVPVENLSIPVRVVFSPIKNMSIEKQFCGYWDFTAVGGLGNWSTRGCWMQDYSQGQITCYCNHLTNFAVIAEVEYTDKAPEHTLALGIITMIGIILSILGLTLTIFTYLLFRKLRKGISQKALLNLAVSLLCVNIIFLVGIERNENYYGCVVVAALLHYFLLVSFGWMLVEGVLQYIKFVKVLNTYVEHFTLKTMLPVWGCPAVICGIVAVVNWRLFHGYENFCWLDTPAFYYAFLLPVCCVIIVNTVLFTLVIKGMTCDRPKGLTSTQSRSELTWLQFKATVSCFVVLGLTWVFGFLAIQSAKLVFQYLFCLLNAFQGFWIFVCYCIREPTVRTHWYNLLRCRRNLAGTSSKQSQTSSIFSSSNPSKRDKNIRALITAGVGLFGTKSTVDDKGVSGNYHSMEGDDTSASRKAPRGQSDVTPKSSSSSNQSFDSNNTTTTTQCCESDFLSDYQNDEHKTKPPGAETFTQSDDSDYANQRNKHQDLICVSEANSAQSNDQIENHCDESHYANKIDKNQDLIFVSEVNSASDQSNDRIENQTEQTENLFNSPLFIPQLEDERNNMYENIPARDSSVHLYANFNSVSHLVQKFDAMSDVRHQDKLYMDIKYESSET